MGLKEYKKITIVCPYRACEESWIKPCDGSKQKRAFDSIFNLTLFTECR